MADIRQCDLCRMPFQSLGGKFCPSCLDKMDKDLIAIREYLYENPGNITINKLAEETGVSRKVILHLVETGRLEHRHNISAGVCEVCKKPIAMGSLCEACRNKVADELAGSVPKPSQAGKKPGSARTQARMHIDRKEE